MKDKILNHLVTIFLNSDNNTLDNMLFNEENDINNHIPAIKNIEKQMNRMKIPYISSEHYEQMDILYDHTSYGNIIITNFKTDNHLLFMYLPEIISEKQKILVSNILYELDECEIHLFKQKGDFFYTEHKDEYVKNKQLFLTKTLQNTKNIKKS